MKTIPEKDLSNGHQLLVEQGEAHKRLFKEHHVYHIQWRNYAAGVSFWASFDTLKEARKFFRSIILPKE